MKKSIFSLVCLMLLCICNASAQVRTLEIVKNGEIVYSSPADEIEYMSVVNLLETPTNVTATLVNNAIVISWNAVTGATSYTVYRSVNDGSIAQFSTSDTNSFYDNTVAEGSKYRYAVKAFGPDDAESHLSAVTNAVGISPEHEYVDLGLPSGLKWATMNVGATTPEEYGNYFAWGETEPKNGYFTDNSLWYGKSYGDLESTGVVDTNGRLTPQYDAATANWGDNWRIPTNGEIDELARNTTQTSAFQNGIYGIIVTSNINGKSIFLPAGGYRTGSTLKNQSSSGYYWSSVPNGTSSAFSGSMGLWISTNTLGLAEDYRYYGFLVRPVKR